MYGVIRAEWIRGSGARFAPRPRPWVARITGTDAQYGLARSFVEPTYDYTYANKKGSRGIVLVFPLAPGLYEIYYATSWKHERRYFARVDDAGEITKVSREELMACLKSAISE